MANMADKRFTNEDRKLFCNIEVDVKKCPDKYVEAGKWLDEYFDIESFWHRKEKAYFNKIYRIQDSYIPERISRELGFWPIMIKLKVFRPISELHKICDNWQKDNQPGPYDEPPEVRAEEMYFKNQDGEVKSKYLFPIGEISEAIEDRLEFYKQREDGVQIEYRLSDAWNDLIKAGQFVSAEKAKSVVLITWLLTDPDADNANLNLTQFEKWHWEREYKLGGTTASIHGGRCDAFSLLGENKETWLGLVHSAWAKIETGKEIGVRLEESTEQEHKGFLRTIANDVYKLISTPDNRAYFRKQVEAFDCKVKELQTELEQIKKDYETNPELKVEAQKVVDQVFAEGSDFNPEVFCCLEGKGFLNNFKDYIYYDNGNYWGPVAQTSDLVNYMTVFLDSPIPDRHKKLPNDGEKLLCYYTMLAVLHDRYVKENTIFFEPHFFNSKDWPAIIWRRIECCNKDTQDWITRAFNTVKDDLARIEPTEIGRVIHPYLSITDLIKHFKIPESQRDAFRKKIERCRENNTYGDDFFREIANPRANEPKYLYETKKVTLIVAEME